MKSMAGNHLWEEKPANQDEFYGWESSLREETSKSGWNPWPEIIPGKRKQQIEMKFRAKSNLGMSVSPNKDETGTLRHDKPSLL